MSMPTPGQKRPVSKAVENLTAQELKEFMQKHGFSEAELSDLLGVTKQGLRLWIRDQREINLTATRVIRMFEKYPGLMREFKL